MMPYLCNQTFFASSKVLNQCIAEHEATNSTSHLGKCVCLIKSVLGRVHNCVSEQALCCEMVALSYVCQPNHSYADFIFDFTQ